MVQSKNYAVICMEGLRDRNTSAGYAVFLPRVEPSNSRPEIYSFTTTSTSSFGEVVLRNTNHDLCKVSIVVQLLNAACSYKPPQLSRDTPSTVSSHNLVLPPLALRT